MTLDTWRQEVKEICKYLGLRENRLVDYNKAIKIKRDLDRKFIEILTILNN